MKVFLNHSNKDNSCGCVDNLEELGGNNTVANPEFVSMMTNKAAQLYLTEVCSLYCAG